MRITEGSTWMRAPADMKECDAANNVNGLMRKGGCSILDCILMEKLTRGTQDSRNVHPGSNEARTNLQLQHWLQMGYPRVVPF